MRQLIKRSKFLRRLYYRLKMVRASSQDDTDRLVSALSAGAPKTFVEFGFHPIEFNCIALAGDRAWSGLLIDANPHSVEDVPRLFHDGISARCAFLTLDSLDQVRNAFSSLGVLSIDVDGNDYWFLKALIDTRPSVICVEYNSSFGLDPITVPYEASFDRNAKHPRAWYHGASLTALAKLCAAHGYGLAAVSSAGLNALFTPDGRLDPAKAWKPSLLRYQYSGVAHDEQWQSLKHMPFERV